MKCPNCGEQIKEKKDKMNFCGFCGTNLKTGEKSFISIPETKAAVQSSNNIADNFMEKAANINTKETTAPVAPPINTNYASPFEQMVKANAVQQQAGGTVQTITPPSFNSNAQQPENTPVVPPVTSPTAAFQQANRIPSPSVPETQNNFVSPTVAFQQANNSANPIVPETPDNFVSPTAAFKQANNSSNSSAPETPDNFVSPTAAFNNTLNSLTPEQSFSSSVSSASEPVSEVTKEIELSLTQNTDDADHDEISKQLSQLDKTSFAPKMNLSKNVKLRTSSDDAESNSITYMEYTNNSKDSEDEIPDKFSSFSFTPPVKESSESVESNTALPDLNSEKSEPAGDSVSAEPAKEISFSSSSDSQDIISLSKETAEPAPEPVIKKEKVINYIGQDKKTAENMLSFKGLIAEFEYVESEKEFDFVIDQSVPADSEVEPGSVVKLTLSAGTWTEWAENAMPVSSSKYITESKTEYRKRSRTRTLDKRETTDTSEYEDYTLVSTDHKYSDWETDQYYTSEAVPQGDTCEIIRMTTGFKYAGWFNPANIQGMSFSSPDVANFFNTNLSNVKWSYDEIISPMNVKPDVKNWKLVTDNMTATPAGDPMISNIFFSAHIIEGKSYAMKYGSAETEWYIYKRRNLLETIYHFEKEIVSDWSEWTEWAETELTASEDCEVESRTLSRSRRKLPNET